jgi:general secretion pathway protein H
MKTPATARVGFTLVEMLVVIVILAIVSAVTVPALRSDPDDEVTTTAGVITRLLAQSRETAVRRGEAVDLIVDAENARYWAVVAETGKRDSVLSYGAIAIPTGANVTADESRSRYTFLPTGGTSGGSLTLRMNSRAAVINLDRWTGDARAEIH